MIGTLRIRSTRCGRSNIAVDLERTVIDVTNSNNVTLRCAARISAADEDPISLREIGAPSRM